MIDDLSISVNEGEALGIVGPNGAGKTTWFNLITGAVHADAGKVIFERQGHHPPPQARTVPGGIGRTFQIPKPFSGMTVFENVLVGATHGRNMAERASYEHCVEILEITGLHKKVNILAGSLTLLDRKTARTGPGSGDRPQAPTARRDRRRPHRGRSGGADRGDHQASRRPASPSYGSSTSCTLSSRWSTASVVIQFGRKLCEGEPHQVMNSQEVQACYMGGTPA